jgi:CHAT domain-containing protein/predicted negative regulator of RcsB-dependent stress response
MTILARFARIAALSAITLSQSFGTLAAVGPTPRERATAAFEHAEALRQRGDKQATPKARALYERAISLWKSAGDSCSARRGWVALAGLEHDVTNWEAQRRAAESALAEPCSGELQPRAQAERLLGSAYINQGDFASGARATEIAVELFRQAGDTRAESGALRNLGLAYAESGELGKAMTATRTALDIAERTADDDQLLALLRNDVAFVHVAKGEFAVAVEAYRQSLAALSEKPYPMAEAVAWINLGLAYSQLGDRDQASSAYEHAEGAAERADCGSCLAEIAVDRGDDLIADGELAKAQASYRQALQIAEAHQLVRQHAEALRGLGRCAMEMQQWSQARSLLESARDDLHRTHGRVNESVVYALLGDLDSKVGRIAAARRNYDAALRVARDASNRTWQAMAQGSLARLLLQSGDLPAARRNIERAIDSIESELTRLDSPGLRTAYLGTQRSYYALYIDILMQLAAEHPGGPEATAALLIAERARARELQDQLAQRSFRLNSEVSPELLTREAAATDRLHALAFQLSQLSATDEVRRRDLASHIDEASRSLDDARARIRAANPRYAELTHPTKLSANEIQQQLLDGDVTVLEYWMGEKHSYLWVVTRDFIRAFALPPAQAIEAEVTALRRQILAPTQLSNSVSIEQRVANEALSTAQARASALSVANMTLPTEARRLLRKTVAVVPDGALQTLPLSLLDDPVAPLATGNTAVRFVSLPSIGTLRGLRALPRTPSTTNTVAVIADPIFRLDDDRLRGATTAPAPRTDSVVYRAASEVGITDLPRLPHTREEAKAIESFANPRSSWIALDFAANRRDALKMTWTQYSVVHFATHALLNSRHPELSGIVLSLYNEDGRPQDGFLRANDIYNLRMPAELVVLSVCDSAVGKDMGAEGPANLARAFFYAGAHRVIASLWPVDDRASVAFMREFYSALFAHGMPAQDALVAAQVALQQNPRWQAPHYWAPYVLLGDWR